jgi:hypothetical protein
MSRAILQEPRGTATPYLEQVFQVHNNTLKYLEDPGEVIFRFLITVSAYILQEFRVKRRFPRHKMHQASGSEATIIKIERSYSVYHTISGDTDG